MQLSNRKQEEITENVEKLKTALDSCQVAPSLLSHRSPLSKFMLLVRKRARLLGEVGRKCSASLHTFLMLGKLV